MDLSQESALKGFISPIARYMAEDDVNEIMVNGANNVWVKRFGRKAVRIDCPYPDQQILGTIQVLASISQRQVGDKSSSRDKAKVISAGIPGFRFEAWTPPVAVNGPAFTVRKLASRLITLEQYTASGAMTSELAGLLADLVKTRRNILVSGPTGSGKTTLCNALLQLISEHDRLLVIETIHELKVSSPNHMLLEADEEQGYSISRLLVSSLRGLPDRIIIGEVRGPEAYGFLKAANTGHPGSIATLHANSAQETLERLEDMVLEGRPELPIDAIRRRIANTHPHIVFMDQVERDGGYQPTLTQVVEVTGYEAGQYVCNPIYMEKEPL